MISFYLKHLKRSFKKFQDLYTTLQIFFKDSVLFEYHFRFRSLTEGNFPILMMRLKH